VSGECSHGRNAPVWSEERFEEAPAVRRHTNKIERKLAQSHALHIGAAVGYEGLTKLTPSTSVADVN
jgi:hypothetical protein